ncbi:MAG: penicillin-binding protein 1C [Desulfobacteraceae bacterium]|nr:penicillin-binding protein 1C [Desulfobacteraceae bacterium]
MKKIIVFILILIILSWVWILIPDPGLYPLKTWSRAYKDKSGNLLRLTLSDDDKYRLFTDIEKIPKNLEKAVLAYEDRFFYYHPGFNPVSILRAFADTYILKKRVVGASTITMQAARLRFEIDSRSLKGKITQILRAVQLERHYSKKKILEAYFNLAPYGGNIEGVGTASEIFFHKSVSDLNFYEACALAVIPQNPSKRYPALEKSEKELENAKKRLVSILGKDENFLPLKYYRISDIPFKAPHFTDFMEKKDLFLKKTFKTTLDLKLQEIIEKRTGSYIEKKKILGIRNAACVLVNYKTGEIEAMAGSADYFNNEIQGQVNGCTSKRSPGSSLKPFVYALALDQGIIHSRTLLKDSPASFGGFSPENYDRKFEGPVFAMDALRKSRNLPAVYLASKIKNPDLHDFLYSCRVTGLKSKKFYGLSLVLGGGETTLLELASLYCVLGNLGEFKSLKFIKDEKSSENTKRVLSREASFIIKNELSKNPPPDGFEEFKKERREVSWKTGTSYGFRDAVAAGIFDNYVLIVWVGNFNGEGNPSFTGRKGAGPLFFDIINHVRNCKSPERGNEMPENLNVKKIDVCEDCGKLPGKYTPHTTKAWFIPGVSPIDVSNLHRPVFIDKKTGLRDCRFTPEETEIKIYEFWSDDMKNLFEKGGIYKKTVPPFKKECLVSGFTDYGISPEITSLSSGVDYIIFKNDRKIPLKASSGPGVENLYWFSDANYIGKTKPEKVFLWQADEGSHIVSVSDDFGRSDRIKINVVYKNVEN